METASDIGDPRGARVAKLGGELAAVDLIRGEKERRLAEKARRSFAEFTRQAWPLVEPVAKLVWNWHMEEICRHLEAVTRGEIQNLLINVPPGTAKSTVVCVMWLPWVWIDRPEWRANHWSYSDDLSLRDSVKTRNIVRSDWYQRNFVKKAWRLSPDQDTKHLFQNTRFGFRSALSIGGTATGVRGDAIVIDDPLNAKQAESKAARDAVITAYDQGIGNRLNDLSTGVRVVIMQRLHEEDLSGHILRDLVAQGERWEHLMLPSEFDPQRRSVTRRRTEPLKMPEPPTGPVTMDDLVEGEKGETHGAPDTATEYVEFFRDPREMPGELLFPAKFPPSALAGEKIRLGSAGYNGQHQQRPAPPEGIIFKRAWFRRWHRVGEFIPEGVESRLLPTKWDLELLSVDAAFKDTKTSDFVAIGVWGRVGPDCFLRDQVCDRLSFPETLKKILEIIAAYPNARLRLIEDKANGPAVISVLRAKVPGIVEVNPQGGKEARAHAVAPFVEAGNVYVPLHAPWVHAYMEEMTSFPKAAHDDQVDETTQALLRLSQTGGNLEFLRKMTAR